jgi:hypothetical protein
MADYVKYDDNHTIVPGIITEKLPSRDSTTISGTFIKVTRAVLNSIINKYFKVSSGVVIEMTQQEKDDLDADEASTLDTNQRTSAKAQFDGVGGLALRALCEIIISELNILRTTHSLADRTLAQLKSSIQSKIDSGDVDE